jgi:hypothetical protein
VCANQPYSPRHTKKACLLTALSDVALNCANRKVKDIGNTNRSRLTRVFGLDVQEIEANARGYLSPLDNDRYKATVEQLESLVQHWRKIHLRIHTNLIDRSDFRESFNTIKAVTMHDES